MRCSSTSTPLLSVRAIRPAQRVSSPRATSSSSTPRTKPIRLILFDAFDTLLTPRIPIHLQYAEEASKAGLEAVDPDRIRTAFKGVFRSLEREWPNYGKGMRVPPEIVRRKARNAGCPDELDMIRVEDWWGRIIEETLIGSGIQADAVERVMPTLGRALMTRFESREGYRAFDDVLPALEQLKSMGVEMGVVSNADDRIVNTISSLKITPYLDGPIITSYTIGYAKPDRRIFWAACDKTGIDRSVDGDDVDLSEVLMVGDEIEADYRGATRAGLRAALIRRPGVFSDGANRQKAEEERAELERDGSILVTGMGGVVDVVKDTLGR